MIQIRRLNSADLPAVRYVTEAVRSSLVNDAWFIPMSEETMDAMFSEGSTLTVYGAFEGDTLAAVALIDTDIEEMADLTGSMKLPGDAGAELGACVVLPEHRGKNLMYLVCQQLVTVARDMGLSYLVASAHPDNIASNHSLKKLGMKHRATLIRCGGYLRNAYCLPLK